MRNAQVAEGILSLVTSPERAASTVGDLVESGAERGIAWFWMGVLRTAFSLMWRDFAADPARWMGLAARGFLLEVIFFGSFGVVVAEVTMAARWVENLFGAVYDPNTLSAPYLIGWVVVGTTVWGFLIGRWLARRSIGSELAPVLALAILNTLFTTLFDMFWPPPGSLTQLTLGLLGDLARSTLLYIPMFAGAVWVRRRRMASAP